MAGRYAVIYDDPKRRKHGLSHTLHAAECADVASAKRRGGNPQPINAESVETALIEARYQSSEPNEGSDLGGVDVAPCVFGR